MQLDIDLDMSVRLGPRRRAMLAIEVARSAGQTVEGETLRVEAAQVRRIAGEGGVGTRAWVAAPEEVLRVHYRAAVTVTRRAGDLAGLDAAGLHALPAEALTWLRPSRLCQSDAFTTFAEGRFGGLAGGAKVAAIRDWVESEIAYLPASSDAGTSVLDTFSRREGVCRDFAHMVCALCRASGIPARYVSAYGLGVTPQDFHAVAQVWLAGEWHLVDATGMSGADRLAVIGVGRDACDAPFLETEDTSHMLSQTIRVRRADA